MIWISFDSDTFFAFFIDIIELLNRYLYCTRL